MPAIPVPPFGDLLRRMRRTVGLTQEQLSERSGVSVRAISDLERGINLRPQRETVRLLAEALELSSEERAALEEAVRPRPAVAPRTPVSVPHNLPAPMTPLVGRADDLTNICALVRRADVRLVTLTGFGGVGKTRLSLEVTRSVLADFRDGVFFISLAAVRDPHDVIPAVAQALGVKESAGHPLQESLIAHLRPKQLLLVLDNFEHVASVALRVADILAAGAGLKMLITSRAPIHVRGEHEWPIEPLAIPEATVTDPDALARYAAVELFVQRARAVRPQFTLTVGNAVAVAAICTRLDGLPLAIELAAVRTKVLPPADLLARLERRLPVLTDGAIDLLPHQQTMRDTIAWSCDLLSVEEQQLFRLLAVFAGGWTLDVAEAVRQAVHGLPDTLSLLNSLVDKSLVRADVIVEHARFAMLETVREYAQELLDASQDGMAAQRAHADYFRALVEGAESTLIGADQAAWLARLDAEHENLRAAMRWAADHDARVGLRIAGASWRFLEARGHLSEGREWLRTMLARALPGQPDAVARTKALNGASMLAYRAGDYAEAVRCSEESIVLARADGDHAALAEALGNLGFIAHRQDDHARARVLLTESLAEARASGDTMSIAVALNRLGILHAYLGEHTDALTYYEESLALHREGNRQRNIGNILDNLGCVRRRIGDYERANTYSGESLAIFRTLNDKWGIANALLNLADIQRDQGLYDGAMALYRESLMHFQAAANRLGIVECIEGIAYTAQGQGDPLRAARLFGAGAALRLAMGSPVPPVGRVAYDRAVADVRAALGAASFETAWAASAALTEEQAIEAALAAS